jgi:hypothetical protein
MLHDEVMHWTVVEEHEALHHCECETRVEAVAVASHTTQT